MPVTSGPTLTHLKSVSVLSDPLNNTSNPKSIPGAMEIYTLRLTNQGSGTVDNNTVAIVDAVPANTALYVQDLGVAGSGPLAFTNGTPSSTLTYTFSGLAQRRRRPGVLEQRRLAAGPTRPSRTPTAAIRPSHI